ncbi:MAG: bile acid:sodium symporter family protein [Gammaproteobacteria bacterium]|nr:bile acid:sodium symporter family protein [Gammaproteobacteria bacterium]
MSSALPVFLFVLMLGMGLTLAPADFKRVALYPKAAAVGLTGQILLLPLCAFLLAASLPLRPEIAMGVMILAVCPGGILSNLITHLARGEVALSVTLTCISSLATVITMPLLLNGSLTYFMGQSSSVELPLLQTAQRIMLITALPIAIGMGIRAVMPGFASRVEPVLRFLGWLFLPLMIYLIWSKEQGRLSTYLAQAGVVTLALSLITLAIGVTGGLLARLQRKQVLTLGIEVGAQNALLGGTVALSPALLNNATMAVVPTIYGSTMLLVLALFVAGFRASERLLPLPPVSP